MRTILLVLVGVILIASNVDAMNLRHVRSHGRVQLPGKGELCRSGSGSGGWSGACTTRTACTAGSLQLHQCAGALVCCEGAPVKRASLSPAGSVTKKATKAKQTTKPIQSSLTPATPTTTPTPAPTKVWITFSGSGDACQYDKIRWAVKLGQCFTTGNPAITDAPLSITEGTEPGTYNLHIWKGQACNAGGGIPQPDVAVIKTRFCDHQTPLNLGVAIQPVDDTMPIQGAEKIFVANPWA